nr:MAG TPA: hypothetical protein [Caudoviricetes sp.]
MESSHISHSKLSIFSRLLNICLMKYYYRKAFYFYSKCT